MTEPAKAQESLLEPAKPEGEAPNLEELQKQIQNLQNMYDAEKKKRTALEEKQKDHNAEMVRKKEREREALEKEKKALEEKGEYAKAAELLQKQLDEAKSFKDEADTIRKQAQAERRKYRVTMALQGKIDPKVPIKRAVAFVDLDKVEWDESDNITDETKFVADFLAKEEWLQPPVGGKTGTSPQPVGSGGMTLLGKEGELVSKAYGLDKDVLERMDEKSIKQLYDNLPAAEKDFSELFQ